MFYANLFDEFLIFFIQGSDQNNILTNGKNYGIMQTDKDFQDERPAEVVEDWKRSSQIIHI